MPSLNPNASATLDGRDPAWRVQLRALVPYGLDGALYALVHVLIHLEATLTSKALPAAVSKTIEWCAVLLISEEAGGIVRNWTRHLMI